jgi:hypothetical protein
LRIGWAKALSFLVMAAVALTVLVALAAPLVLVDTRSTLSTSEEGWTGASEILGIAKGTGARVMVLTSTPTLLLEDEDPGKVLFISLGPQRRYSLTEDLALKKFTERGGRLLVADDEGRTARVAEDHGITYAQGQLYDQDFVGDVNHLKFRVSTAFFDGFVLMNRPASLFFTSGVALVASSSSAWVDQNGNGLNDNLSSGSPEAQGVRYLCVLTEPDLAQTGGGGAVFISDPSMFMNGMLGSEGNREFARALIEFLLPEGGRIVIDDSVHEPPLTSSPLRKAVYGVALFTTDINMKIVVGTLVTLALLSIAYLYNPLERPEHVCLLDRSGVAELAEPELSPDDVREGRKVLLDRVRLSNGLSIEAFSKLSWDDLDRMIGDRALSAFARNGRHKGTLGDIMVEVGRWQRK